MASVQDSESPTIQIERDLKELAWLVGKWPSEKDTSKTKLQCVWMAHKNFLRIEISVHGKSGEIPGGVQIIGRNSLAGEVISWNFSANGGYGTGVWQKNGTRWSIPTATPPLLANRCHEHSLSRR